MCKPLVIIKQFREFKSLEKYVPGGNKAGNALAEISCENLGPWVGRKRPGNTRGYAGEADETERLRPIQNFESGPGVASPSSAISLSGKLNEFSPA
jgi:hypothetical protein